MPIDVLQHPRCQPNQLGLPIPDDPHAVSVCLPTWNDIVGYEEKDERVISRLQAAYPRFGFHPLIDRLRREQIDADGWTGLPFPNRQAAERVVEFCSRRNNVEARIQEIGNGNSTLFAVSVPEADFPTLKEYWQHAGENLSSRAIEGLSNGQGVSFTETEARRNVRARFAQIQQTSDENVFLYPSGMAAIAAAFRTTQTVRPGTTCQFGFPYVDTLKIQQKFRPGDCLFLPLGDRNDLQKLKDECQQRPISTVYCEVPTNPLLVTPDLIELSQMAQTFGFLLVIDDTLTACGNIHTLPFGDITVTSLTKSFSGGGNILAGALTVNPDGPAAKELLRVLQAEFQETLCDDDAQVLAANSQDVAERMSTTNSNANQLASFLREHRAVDRVFYPSAADRNYEQLRSPEGGYGGLMSILLKDAPRSTASVYDALQVNKGPNLGTRFTLCCPFPMLAHYNELDFAESCGVSRWLLRISVGLEDIDDLRNRFRTALEERVP